MAGKASTAVGNSSGGVRWVGSAFARHSRHAKQCYAVPALLGASPRIPTRWGPPQPAPPHLVGVREAQRTQCDVAQRNMHAVRCRPRRHNKLRLPHCLEGVQQRHTGGQAQQLQEQTRGMGSKGMRRGCSLTEGSMPCSLADSMACLRLFQSDWIYRSATTARFKMHAAHLGSHLPDLLLGRHVAHVVSCCSRAWKIASNHQIQHASSMGDSAASPSVRASHRVALLSQTMCLSTATHFMHACAGPT